MIMYNISLVEKTSYIGNIDRITSNHKTLKDAIGELIHLELAYKEELNDGKYYIKLEKIKIEK